MNQRILLTGLVALGVFGSIFGYKFMQIRAAQAKMAARTELNLERVRELRLIACAGRYGVC